MAANCPQCGEQRTYARARFQVGYRGGVLIADNVPALRCEQCGRTDPAGHVRAHLDGVIELVQEVPGATARKDFARLPLRPDDAPPEPPV